MALFLLLTSFSIYAYVSQYAVYTLEERRRVTSDSSSVLGRRSPGHGIDVLHLGLWQVQLARHSDHLSL